MVYIRQDMADIRVSLDGVQYGDSWASADGGALDSDDVKTRPGGMGHQVAVGGPPSRGDLTVSTQYTDVVARWRPAFEARVGCGRIKVGYQRLDCNRAPIGPTKSIVGILKTVTEPNVDANSSEVGMFEIVVSCDELAA